MVPAVRSVKSAATFKLRGAERRAGYRNTVLFTCAQKFLIKKRANIFSAAKNKLLIILMHCFTVIILFQTKVIEKMIRK